MNRYFKGAVDFARNYWDLGAAILGGLALGDYQNQVFGNLRAPIVLGSIMASIVGSGIERYSAFGDSNPLRFFRNFYAGAASFSLFFGAGGIFHSPDADGLVGAGFFASGSGLAEIFRRKTHKLVKLEDSVN